LSYSIHIDSFIDLIPKAELHVHLEGTIEAEQMLFIADRNKIPLKYENIDQIQAAYKFESLKDFLHIYNEGTKILRTAEDFYDVAYAYLKKAAEQKVLHTEIFIDFQTYTRRGISPQIQMDGLIAAIDKAKKDFGISALLILCFLRHLGPKAAMESYQQVLEYQKNITGIGLASSEIGFPPELFTEVFKEAKKDGFKLVAHAGEEGPWQYVKNSIEYLAVDRIDHGNKSCENAELSAYLVEKQIPLTLCPLSNIKLKNVGSMEEHSVRKMLDQNMMVTINSDDPAYFGGYINDNFKAVAHTFNFSKEEIYKLARNSFVASFISNDAKKGFIGDLDSFMEKWR